VTAATPPGQINLKVLQLLIEKKADARALNVEGHTVLEHCHDLVRTAPPPRRLGDAYRLFRRRLRRKP
jgi:hypothetical protein